jgi:hypothetical protein
MPPREIPTWLRAIINLVALAGVAVTFMGKVQFDVGIVISIMAAIYFLWEATPWLQKRIERWPLISLAVFIFVGSGSGAGIWWALKTTATKPAVSIIVPSVTWGDPSPIEYGSPLTDKQLNAKASVEGNFSYNPDVGTVLPVGRQPITATFTPADKKAYDSISRTIFLVVNPSQTQRSSHSTPIDQIQYPLVVKINIFMENLSIENKGKTAITDVMIAWASFTFNKEAYGQKKIVFSEVSFPSGGQQEAALIKSGQKIKVDLKKLLPKTMTFEEMLKAQLIPFEQPEYGIRVTFRDERTNQKFACYKVLSSVFGMPEMWGDYAATAGAAGRLWIEDIPKMIIDRMKSHYQDGAVDFQCDR